MKNKTLTFNENEISIKKYREYAIQFTDKKGKVTYFGDNKDETNYTHLSAFESAYLYDIKTAKREAIDIKIIGYYVEYYKKGRGYYETTKKIPSSMTVKIVQVNRIERKLITEETRELSKTETKIDVEKLATIQVLQETE